MKRLYRSSENKNIFGILGGLGEYFDIDPAVFRLVYICAAISTGIVPLVIAYFICCFIVPKRPAEATEV